MKFSEHFSIKKDLSFKEFSSNIWNPGMNQWRDVIEDFLYISRKRIKNKLCMFKLQLNILEEIVNNYKIIDKYDGQLKKVGSENGISKIPNDEYEKEKKHIESEIFKYKFINKSLKEIADGIVWKYFNYNRAILYLLADKQPIDVIRPDEGTLTNIYAFANAFTEPDSIAIFNDITNFLRIGDVTQIKDNGDIEIIEVKSGKPRGRRITRQKQRMSELVEFVNTGYRDYDGKKLKILDSEIKQKNYLNILYDGIKKARNKGFDSLSIGNYLIIEIFNPSKIDNSDVVLKKIDSKQGSIKENWEKNKDIVQSSFLFEKMDYSKNCAPFSIYPFDLETCTDIMFGRLLIKSELNFSEIYRMIEKNNWKIVDGIHLKSEEEIASMSKTEIEKMPFMKINKGPFTIDVPPSILARIQFELLAPSVMIEQFEEILSRGPQDDFNYFLTNYIDEQNVWGRMG